MANCPVVHCLLIAFHLARSQASADKLRDNVAFREMLEAAKSQLVKVHGVKEDDIPAALLE